MREIEIERNREREGGGEWVERGKLISWLG